FIEPLCVIDNAEHRTTLCRFRQQSHNGETNKELVRHCSRAQPKRRLQGFALWCRKPIEQVEKRCAELMQPCEWEFRLRLHSYCTQYCHVRGRLTCPLQQGRLSDPGLSGQYERCAVTCTRAIEQSIEGVALPPPTPQYHGHLAPSDVGFADCD